MVQKGPDGKCSTADQFAQAKELLSEAQYIIAKVMNTQKYMDNHHTLEFKVND